MIQMSLLVLAVGLLCGATSPVIVILPVGAVLAGAVIARELGDHFALQIGWHVVLFLTLLNAGYLCGAMLRGILPLRVPFWRRRVRYPDTPGPAHTD